MILDGQNRARAEAHATYVAWASARAPQHLVRAKAHTTKVDNLVPCEKLEKKSRNRQIWLMIPNPYCRFLMDTGDWVGLTIPSRWFFSTRDTPAILNQGNRLCVFS